MSQTRALDAERQLQELRDENAVRTTLIACHCRPACALPIAHFLTRCARTAPQRLRAGRGSGAGGTYYSQPAPGGSSEGIHSFVKFVLFVLVVVVVLGGVGHAKKNKLGPFAPSRNMKKSDGALGGTWETDSAFPGGAEGMSSLYDGGGGMGGGGYMAQPATSAWPSPAPMPAADSGPGFAPPGAAEARAALSRRR